MDQAAVVVALLSPVSLRRPWVNIELGAAWIKHRHIIPLCHSALRVGDLPRPFGDFHGVGLDQDDAAERLIGGVADGLRLEQPRRLAFKEMLAELRSA
ncbi:MAG: TIR domain-containing protein, partial [Gammaproteobacteria bacterium]